MRELAFKSSITSVQDSGYDVWTFAIWEDDNRLWALMWHPKWCYFDVLGDSTTSRCFDITTTANEYAKLLEPLGYKPEELCIVESRILKPPPAVENIRANPLSYIVRASLI